MLKSQYDCLLSKKSKGSPLILDASLSRRSEMVKPQSHRVDHTFRATQVLSYGYNAPLIITVSHMNEPTIRFVHLEPLSWHGGLPIVRYLSLVFGARRKAALPGGLLHFS